MDQELPPDPDDVETATIKLRIDGHISTAWAELGVFEDYVIDTEHLEGERAELREDANGRVRAVYKLSTDRTGVIAPAIERLCDILKVAPDLHAQISVPGYSKTFYGYERDFVVRGQIAGSC